MTISTLAFSVGVIATQHSLRGNPCLGVYSTVPTTSRPLEAALGDDGTVVVLRRSADCTSHSVLIRRTGERPRSLSAPSLAMITAGLVAQGSATNVAGEIQKPSIENVVLDGSGDLYVTVADRFEGAYSGVRRGIFEYSSGSWKSRVVRFVRIGSDVVPTNATVGAATSRSVFVANADYGNVNETDLSRLGVDPAYRPPQAAIASGTTSRSLGTGYVLSARSAELGGYFASSTERSSPFARVWNDQRYHVVGRGIVFAVDTGGVAVGDNRRVADGIGSPTIWLREISQRLCEGTGTASGIRGREIVGRLNGEAFIVFDYRERPKCVRLTSLVPPGWSIGDAYSISGSGAILAIGSFRQGPTAWLLLTPQIHSH